MHSPCPLTRWNAKLFLHPQTKTIAFSPLLRSEAYCFLSSFAATFTKPVVSLRNGVNAISAPPQPDRPQPTEQAPLQPLRPRSSPPQQPNRPQALKQAPGHGEHSFVHQATLKNRSGIYFCPQTASGAGLPPARRPYISTAAGLCPDFAHVVLLSCSACLSFPCVSREWHCAARSFWSGPSATLSL